MSYKKEINAFLKGLEKFYAPKHPELKDGIGHEIEHLKGVVMRSDIICEEIINNPNIEQEPDKNIVKAVAALHDIGNIITRAGHNNIGAGIVRGQLRIDDILDTPMETVERGKKKILTESEMEHLRQSIGRGPLGVYFEVKDLSEREKNALHIAMSQMVAFDIGFGNITPTGYTVGSIYPAQRAAFDEMAAETSKAILDNGINLFKNEQYWIDRFGLDPNDEKDQQVIKQVMKQIFDQDDLEEIDFFRNDISARKIDNIKLRAKDIHFDPRLKDVSSDLAKTFSDNKFAINIIADAVQDHNIDWYADDAGNLERYKARSIYGAIVADADKDSCPATFAMRSMLFTINKLHTKDGWKLGELNKAQKKELFDNVLAQANQRYRAAYANKSECYGLYAYQKQPSEIKSQKGVTLSETVKESEEKKYFNWSKGVTEAGQYYGINPAGGDDNYSQLNHRFGEKITNKIWQFIDSEITRKWADPNQIKQSYAELNYIYEVLAKAQSIEQAVAIMEKDNTEKITGKKINDMSWSTAIDNNIDDNYIGPMDKFHENKYIQAAREAVSDELMVSPKYLLFAETKCFEQAERGKEYVVNDISELNTLNSIMEEAAARFGMSIEEYDPASANFDGLGRSTNDRIHDMFVKVGLWDDEYIITPEEETAYYNDLVNNMGIDSITSEELDEILDSLIEDDFSLTDDVETSSPDVDDIVNFVDSMEEYDPEIVDDELDNDHDDFEIE